MSKELIRQLKSLKHADIKPSELWLQKNRELLLSQIKNTVSKTTSHKFTSENVWQGLSIFLPQSFVYKIVRPAMVFVLIFVMGIGSWAATVSASYESLPGDWLYSAKRATERTQVAVIGVVGDKKDVVKLHGELAKKRAEETRNLVSQNDPKKVQIASETVKDLKNEIKTINTKLEEMKSESGSGADAIKNVNQNTQEISGVLKEVRVNLLANNEKDSNNLSSEVSEIKNLVKDTSVKAVEIMVEKHNQGDTSVSKEEIKEVISAQLQSAVQNAAQSQQNIVEVNKAVDIVKSEAVATAKESSGTVSQNATNQVISDKIEATSKQTQAAITSAQSFNAQAGKTAGEGQVLLSQDNLSQAVDKIKEANAATTQVEKITDSAVKAVQNILPVVAIGINTPSTTTLTTTSSSTVPVIVITTTPSTTIKINPPTTTVLTTTPKTTTTKP